MALSNGGSIAALADVIYDQYRLPVDYYVSVDMQALVEMVDNFGGIGVYPPGYVLRRQQVAKGLPEPGWFLGRVLRAVPYGALDYANSDIDRLNMQRYFYAGLFKRARAMGITDIP